MTGIKICGTGSYLPDNFIENQRFSEIVETSDEWIRTRTGIEKRPLVDGDTVWSMGLEASRQAIEASGISPEEIDMVLVTTVTPDWITPSLSCALQGMLGAHNALCVDINCACAGYVYALDMARRYLCCGDVKTILLVGSEMLSRMVDFTDRSTCVLFGDGAGACVVRAAEDGVYGSHLGADGTGYDVIYTKNTSTRSPFSKKPEVEDAISRTPTEPGIMIMDGRETYKFASRVMPEALQKACEKAGVAVEQLDWIIPHQANIRIVQTAMKHLGLPMERAYMNIYKTGNTSSASIGIALDELNRSGKLTRGQKVGFVGFGAGLIYGAAVIEW